MESMLHNQKLSATRRQRLAASSGNSGLSSSLAFTQFEVVVWGMVCCWYAQRV